MKPRRLTACSTPHYAGRARAGLSLSPITRNGLAQRLAVVGRSDDLFGAVTIVSPGGSYALATEHSPLPLAQSTRVQSGRLQVDAPLNQKSVSYRGHLPLRVPIEVNFTQRVAVDRVAADPDGVAGEPVRLSVPPALRQGVVRDHAIRFAGRAGNAGGPA